LTKKGQSEIFKRNPDPLPPSFQARLSSWCN